MNLKPSDSLSQREITRGLNLVIKDGLAAEAMAALTGGTFLVAMALQLGATNFQIGLLAALPTLTNIFQLLAIWLVQKYNNRRAVAVLSNLFARFPLLIIGLLPFLFTTGTSIQVLIYLLFFHYFFGSIAGASWNSWMKDLVPESKLGTYFSHRSRLTQTLNVVLSLVLALALDYVKRVAPEKELIAYAIMFLGGGLFGLLGTYILSRTPEPRSYLAQENLLKLFGKPLKDRNFRNLLVFNSFWSFALNLATPFFSVYMMKIIGLPLSYIIGLGILSQVAGICAIRVWGKHSDKYSNKTIIGIAAPVYIACIIGWLFVGMSSSTVLAVSLIGLINILTGISSSGINLAITNIGMKLAPREEAIVYLSARNMIVAFVSALGPLIGGWLADFFATRSLIWNIQWNGPGGTSVFRLVELHNWNFLFLIGGILAIAAVKTLSRVKEEGEVEKDLAVAEMRIDFRNRLKEKMTKQSIVSLLLLPVTYPVALKKKVVNRIEKRVVSLKRWNGAVAERKRA
ncbi:MAG TPA: MFS transporter [Flavisolibacter sp.]|nr:MFS transporter [Flavisolibacter sp.]